MNDLPEGWVSIPLAVVADLVRGVTYSKKDAISSPKAGYLPILRATNINGHLSLASEMVYVPARYVRSEQQMKMGDIVVAASSGSLSVVGKSAQLRQAWKGGFGAFCSVIRPDPSLAPSYLAHLVTSPRIRTTWRDLAKGTNINNLKSSDLASTSIPLPPFKEQERIVTAIEEQLSRLDAGVAALKRAEHNLKRVRAAVLQAAVTGELLDMSAEDWESAMLGELLDGIEAGKSFKCEERPARLDEWGVIKVSAMTWGTFRSDENKTVLAGRAIDLRTEIRPGDLLVSRANTVDYVGAVVQVRECRPRLLLSDKSLRLTSGPNVLPEWLVVVLRSQFGRRYIERVATGTSDSMRNISQQKLRALVVPVPSIAIQKRLTEEVDRRFSLLDEADVAVATELRHSRSLRASILATAFSGKLVPQDPSDEPAPRLLERITAEHGSSDGQELTRTRRRRRSKVTP
jgi:type I restriction enzyme, S subunit